MGGSRDTAALQKQRKIERSRARIGQFTSNLLTDGLSLRPLAMFSAEEFPLRPTASVGFPRCPGRDLHLLPSHPQQRRNPDDIRVSCITVVREKLATLKGLEPSTSAVTERFRSQIERISCLAKPLETR
jgi:hypothetical protein